MPGQPGGLQRGSLGFAGMSRKLHTFFFRIRPRQTDFAIGFAGAP